MNKLKNYMSILNNLTHKQSVIASISGGILVFVIFMLVMLPSSDENEKEVESETVKTVQKTTKEPVHKLTTQEDLDNMSESLSEYFGEDIEVESPYPVYQKQEKPKVPKTVFGDGTYIVGVDIEPGTYKNSDGDNCYYKRMSGFSGESGDIISSEYTEDSAIITISGSDKGFLSSGCGTWTKI